MEMDIREVQNMLFQNMYHQERRHQLVRLRQCMERQRLHLNKKVEQHKCKHR